MRKESGLISFYGLFYSLVQFISIGLYLPFSNTFLEENFQFEFLDIDLMEDDLNLEMLVWKDTFDQSVCFYWICLECDCSIQRNEDGLTLNWLWILDLSDFLWNEWRHCPLLSFVLRLSSCLSCWSWIWMEDLKECTRRTENYRWKEEEWNNSLRFASFYLQLL